MWSFSYTGRGCADQAEARAAAEITVAAERQLKDTPERAHKHIRAAKDYALEIAKSTNALVSIVAEGWVEEDGHAGATINVSVAASVASAET